jgi:formate hydrogenlyase subunit 3/multisubunit Na+/H+ antiporter MnhD subunit
MVLFVALITLAYQHDGATTFRTLVSDSPGGLVVLLLIIGFGIKLALPGLHFWLPQAYAVSPTSAVMVLSGAMIKAGLLGWLRFLPGGDDALVNWGQALFIIGIIGMFYGAIMGLLQHRPRLLLGYSSISKMGTITTGMGAALLWPASASLMMAALVIYAAHHALIKGALFLSVGLIERGGLRLWLLVGLIVLSLAMAGAPLTSGALAKSMVSTAIPAQAEYFLSVLALAAFMTTLLMARFLFLIYSQSYPVTAINDVGAITAWLLLLDIIVVWPMLVATEDQLWAGILPLTIGIIVAWIALFYRWRLPGRTRMTKTYAIRRCFLLRSKKGIQDLLHALQTLSAKFMSGGAWAYPRRQWHAGQRLLQFLRVHDDIQLWHVTAGLWLGIAAVLMTIFILAR